jgi:hypothetical protein
LPASGSELLHDDVTVPEADCGAASSSQLIVQVDPLADTVHVVSPTDWVPQRHTDSLPSLMVQHGDA